MLPKVVSSQTVEKKYGRRVTLETFDDGQEWLLFDSDRTPVIVFPINAAGEVILTEQYRRAAQRVILEFPGGLIEPSEGTLKAAVRELKEEAGHESQTIRVIADPVWFDPCCFKERFIPALAFDCNKLGESEDGYKVRTFPMSVWFRMCANGEVDDSKTLAMSMLALRHLPDELRAQAIVGLATP